MTHRVAATATQRQPILNFLADAGEAGVVLAEKGSLITTEIPIDRLTGILDLHLGIDRAALAAERAAQLTPGGDCAC